MIPPELEEIRQKLIKPYWVKRVRLIALFHSKAVALYGKAGQYRPREGKSRGWGLNETAEQLNMSRALVSRSLQLARALKQDPTLAGIENEGEAYKKAHG